MAQDLTTEEVCRAIGERVRELRTELGLTMERFADEAGLSIGMLSKIEHGQTSASLNSLTAIANVAGVPFTSFFRGLDEEHDAVIVPAGGGIKISHVGDSKGRTYHDLGAVRGPYREMEPVLVTITKPDEVFPVFQHAGIELIHVLDGVVEYGYGNKRYTLKTGDTMQFKGEVAHGPTRLLSLPIRFLSIKMHAIPEAG